METKVGTVFADGGGDFYVVDLGDGGGVRHFRIEESEYPIVFRSLSRMVETLGAAFASGTFFVDHEGYLEMSDEEFAARAARLNPDVEWWRG